jgi:MFS family permease
MNTTEKLSQLEKKVAISLASVFGFRMIGLFVILPVFATYGLSLEHVTPTLIGVAMGAYGCAQALLQIPMGMLSDKFGRKPVIYAGLIMFALGSLIAGCSESIYGVIAGRVMQGMGAISSAVLALAADLSRDEQRIKVMGIIGACIGLSFAIALFLGSFLAKSIGLSGLFFLTAALACVSFWVVAVHVPTPMMKAPVGDTTPSLTKLKQTLRHGQLLRLNFGIFVLHLILTAVFVVLPLQMLAVDLPKESHWMVYLPAFVLSVVGMVPMMLIAVKRQQTLGMFRVALVMLATGLGLMHYVLQDTWALVGAMTLFFIGFNFLEASLPSLIAKICPIGAKGSAMGVYSSCQFLGAFCGGVLGGTLYQHWDAWTLLLVCMALLGVWLLTTWGMQVPAGLKSYTLAVKNAEPARSKKMLEQLHQLVGVAEVVVVPSEHAAYLRADERFDLKQARAIVGYKDL